MENEVRKHLHGISNGLQAAFDALENIEFSFLDDVDYCQQVLKLSKSEKMKAFNHINELKKILKELEVGHE